MIQEIAVILTCFNRREKTTRCLKHLFMAKDNYNKGINKISLAIYLTDDGCTDGTANAVRRICKNEELHIIKGNGNCYWAGGMRLAWLEALKDKTRWEFYLLLNDDTIVKNNVFDELFYTHDFSISTYGLPGIYSGITCEEFNNANITYGGNIFASKIKGSSIRLKPSKKPQMVDETNANILFVSSKVVETIGIFHDKYVHSCADYDYCMETKKNGFPTLLTANICGYCEYDHSSEGEEIRKLMGMTFAQRKKYMSSPIHSDMDYLLYVKRNIPCKYLISWTLRKIRLYLPALYYIICKVRGLDSYKIIKS